MIESMNIKLLHGDCLELMKDIPDKSVDLTVTSPPYDNLRSYNGNNDKWNVSVWKSVITDLFRITKDGGVVVWIVNDATIAGSETGTSFRQALHAMSVGFKLHDTMIYNKTKYIPLTHRRYEQAFEYMFVFVKGQIKTFNGLVQKTKHAGVKPKRTFYQNSEQNEPTIENTHMAVKDTKLRSNVWQVTPGVGTVKGHPAQFPPALAQNHIMTWSNEGNVILDPFMGSGTTGVACLNTNRNFIGIELDDKYFEIAKQRINEARNKPKQIQLEEERKKLCLKK